MWLIRIHFLNLKPASTLSIQVWLLVSSIYLNDNIFNSYRSIKCHKGHSFIVYSYKSESENIMLIRYLTFSYPELLTILLLKYVNINQIKILSVSKIFTDFNKAVNLFSIANTLPKGGGYTFCVYVFFWSMFASNFSYNLYVWIFFLGNKECPAYQVGLTKAHFKNWSDCLVFSYTEFLTNMH